MSCKSEIFAELLSFVSKETDVPEDSILSKAKDSEAVDARYILVHLLSEKGLYPSTIASFLGMKTRSVNFIISDFGRRISMSPIMKLILNRIRNSSGMFQEQT